MLYHVIRRPPHNNTNLSNNQSTSNQKNGSIPTLMPRYHYSRATPNSATTSSESFFSRLQANGQSPKPSTPMTTTSNNNNNNNNNNQHSYGSFKSTFIPLVSNTRTMTPTKREFIQIPITREDGTSTTNNSIRSVPITFISDTNSSPSTPYNTTRVGSPKPLYASLLRPSSKYFQHTLNNNNNNEESTGNIPRLPSVSRRLSLTIPVMTTTTVDEETIKQNTPPPSSSIRQIPIRLSQPSNAASIPTNSSRISSAILRSSPLPNSSNNQLHRQKTDLTDMSSSDFTSALSNTSPVRRAEVMAREAIQGVARFQQQQQRNGSIFDSSPNSVSMRSPSLSRRVIINLKNNQSVSLDSRLSSANSSATKPPPVPSSVRLPQRNNLYHIPVLHEVQMPSHPATVAAENSSQFLQPPSASDNNNNSYKNEFRMEIPVTIVSSNDQENRLLQNDGIGDYDPFTTIVTESVPSINGNTNQTLKSILKRSASRDTVSRKNVSFINP